MKKDIGYAFRMLRKQPGFSAIAILTLALGIGANTAIFSIVNAVLLRPLPYPNADRIMVLNESSGPGQDYSVALPDYFDWRNDNTVFEHLAATHKESRNLSGIPGRDPERVSCASVTRNFFNIVGLPPEIGRTFGEDEDKVGAPPVVVISDRLWRRIFNADPGVLGRSITLHDQNYTVIGVMPPGFDLPYSAEVWVPMQIAIRTNIHNDFKPEVRILKSPPDFLPARRALQQVAFDQIALFAVCHSLAPGQGLVPTAVRLLEDDPGKDFQLRFRFVFDQSNFGFCRGLGHSAG